MAKTKNNVEVEEKTAEETEGAVEVEEKKEEGKEVKEEIKEKLAGWKPKTGLGRAVKERKIKSLEEIYGKGLKILEPEIVDFLTDTETDLLAIGQAKGKFGGGKRRIWRQTQRKTAEGNIPSFSCLAVVGNKDGYVGLGYGKGKETLPAREKAIQRAKLNIIKVNRGCGSFDCACNEGHSIPFKIEGKVGSSHITLSPAPKGTGLVIDDECKRIMRLAGIKDIYSRTKGQTRTKMNLAYACIDALEKTNKLVK